MKENAIENWYWPDEMGQLVDFLNEGKWHVLRRDKPFQDELRVLIDEWLKAKSDWRRFLNARLKAGKPVHFTSGTFHIAGQARTPFMIPLGLNEGTEAQGVFQRFILNPEHWRLGGPCRRKGCGRYFLRKTAHEKIYCDQSCASRATAVQKMAEARDERHKKLVRAAGAMIKKFKQTRKRGDWKVWVAAEVGSITGIEITPKSLARWVREGELKAPE